MSAHGVTELCAVEIGVPDLDVAVRFYEDIWGLAPVKRNAAACYFRASGPEQYVLALHRRPKPEFVQVRLGCETRDAVDAVYKNVQTKGGAPLGRPGALDTPGSGYGFAFRDPEGRVIQVVSDVQRHADARHANDRPYKLSHVVFNSTKFDDAAAFFRDALGFKLRDRTRKANFMGCNADHHCIAFTDRKNTALSHVAYELPDLDSELRGCGRLKKAGMEIQWGVGRHGTGDNVFAYYLDPNNFAVEYTTEMQQVDDATYVQGTVDTNNRPSHADVWGLAEPPTPQFLRALEG
jgi:catechol-2,3-dioxygenase